MPRLVLRITPPSEVRPEGVTPPFLELVRKYCNNKSLTVGAQSGSEERLLAIGRGHGVEEIRRAARWAREYGFTSHLDFIFGFPVERGKGRRETVVLVEELVSLYGAKIHAHYFMPLPGTPYAGASQEPLHRWLMKRLVELSRLGMLDGSWQEQAKEVGAWD
ncbi:MAG TPA: radical SAM protein [Thermosulfidibacter takaii]|uniref:Radical SAM protein n=1 Tax=Thermosulfidibacter takaii TaxID=412593 RepID=A0A7C0U5P1_9BACT|nr:radical SAM protein [Thermosulfidibacter takaii]